MGAIKILGYYNGAYGEADEIKIPLLDRAVYFGDGVYDATACSNRVIFALEEHIDRFFSSASQLRMKLPYSKAWLKDELYRMVDQVESEDSFVYWQASRGTAQRKHAFPDVKPNLAIIITPFKLPDLNVRYKLVTYKDLRFEYCNIKTLNLIPSVLAAEAAESVGSNEAVFYREGGIVTECAHSNISILKGNVLYTHPANNLILPGIARKHLLAKARELSLDVREDAFGLDDLYLADEILITNSGNICAAVDFVDGRPAGGKNPEIVKRLQNSLLEEFMEETNSN